MAIVSKHIDGESVLIQASQPQPYNAEYVDGNSYLTYEHIAPPAVGGRVMSSLIASGGLASNGGLIGNGGGLAG